MLRIFLLFCISAAALSHAVTSYSPAIGGMTISVPSGQTQSISLPLLHESVGTGKTRGLITSVGTNYIDVSGANWTAGQFSSASNPYYLRILSGSSRGRVLLVTTTPNTTNRVTINNDGIDLTGEGGLQPGDRYELVLADTLSSLFGDAISGGSDASNADNVLIWGGSSWQVYYFNSIRSRWELKDLTFLDVGNTVLRPDRGMLITRRGGTDLTLRVMGRVRQTTFLVTGVPESENLSVTLSDLALQNLPGWVKGNSPDSADTIQIWGGASWQTYYFDSVNNRWQLKGLSFLDAGATKLSGRPVMIQRANSASTTESLITMPLPYST